MSFGGVILGLNISKPYTHWARISVLLGYGFTYDTIAHKMAEETNEPWNAERVRTIVRSMRDNPKMLPGILSSSQTWNLDLKGEKRILVISDVHHPLNISALDAIVREHRDWDYLMINGDYMDFDWFAKFEKDNYGDPKNEFIGGHTRLLHYSSYFANILATTGNHDERISMYFQRSIDRGIRFLVSDKKSCWRVFSKGLTIEVFTPNEDGDEISDEIELKPIPNLKYTDQWYALVGDVLICHPRSAYRPKMKTLVESDQFFQAWGLQGKYRALIMGHTHRASQGPADCWPKRFLYEPGCLCRVMDYATKGTVTQRPPALGYMEVVMWDGEFDPEKSRMITIA